MSGRTAARLGDGKGTMMQQAASEADLTDGDDALRAVFSTLDDAIRLLSALQPSADRHGARWWDFEIALRDLHGARIALAEAAG